MYEGQYVDKYAFGETFSDDSLGESTRSLLSPIYGDGGKFELPDLSEGSLSSDEEITSRNLQQFKDNGKYSSDDRRKSNSSSKRRSSTSRNTTYLTSSSTARHKLNKSSSKSPKSVSSRTVSPSRTVDSSKKGDDRGGCLSPWESWLVQKSAEDRKKEKQRRLEKKKEKEECERKQQEREELLKAASEKYNEWLERKTKTTADERIMKKQLELSEREKKENLNRSTHEKAEVKYNNWVEDKKAQRIEQKDKEQIDARVKKDKEVERRMLSEEAYSQWIKKVKEQPQPIYNSFAYTGGMLTGYYEWGAYPAPSYCNPIPWVPPKVKRNNERRKGKTEMQQPSPPLLFRDIDIRKAAAKKKYK